MSLSTAFMRCNLRRILNCLEMNTLNRSWLCVACSTRFYGHLYSNVVFAIRYKTTIWFDDEVLFQSFRKKRIESSIFCAAI